MNLTGVASACVVATASALVFFAIAMSRAWLGSLLPGRSPFAATIRPEAGQSYRDAVRALDHNLALRLTTVFVFSSFFLVSLIVSPEGWLPAESDIFGFGLLGILAIALLYFGTQSLRMVTRRSQLRYQRDANIAVGHALATVFTDGSQLFHSVGGRALYGHGIDHVIAGPKGIYAVHVIASRRAARKNSGDVELRGTELVFDGFEEDIPVDHCFAAEKALRKFLHKKLGMKTPVRSVLAVPAWTAAQQSSADTLVVNERTVGMLRGWTDPQYFLLDEQFSTAVDVLKSLSGKAN